MHVDLTESNCHHAYVRGYPARYLNGHPINKIQAQNANHSRRQSLNIILFTLEVLGQSSDLQRLACKA